MASSMQDATIFIDALDVDAQLFFKDINLLVQRQLTTTEKPRTAEGGTTNHDGIDTIRVESLVGIGQRLDVAIANNRNVNMGIALDLTDERPVSITCIHLATGTSMNRQSLNATLLQLLASEVMISCS